MGARAFHASRGRREFCRCAESVSGANGRIRSAAARRHSRRRLQARRYRRSASCSRRECFCQGDQYHEQVRQGCLLGSNHRRIDAYDEQDSLEVCLGVGRARSGRDRSATGSGRIGWQRRSDLYQRHRADSAAQLPELPSAGRRRADVARHVRRRAAVGARDQAAHRHRAARRRDAAVVRREEHRHPAVQERSVAERPTKSRRSRSGPTAARRAAIRPTCRRRSDLGRRPQCWHIGTPDLDRQDDGSRRERRTRRTGGARFRACRPA